MAYERHTWQCGDNITADLLNNIEDGVEEALKGSLHATFCGTTQAEGDAALVSGMFITTTPREIRTALAFGDSIDIYMNPAVSEILGNTSDDPATIVFVKDEPNEETNGGTLTFRLNSVLTGDRIFSYDYTYEKIDQMVKWEGGSFPVG